VEFKFFITSKGLKECGLVHTVVIVKLVLYGNIWLSGYGISCDLAMLRKSFPFLREILDNSLRVLDLQYLEEQVKVFNRQALRTQLDGICIEHNNIGYLQVKIQLALPSLCAILSNSNVTYF